MKLIANYSAIRFQYAMLVYNRFLNKTFKNFSREDVSAFAQDNLEELAVDLVTNTINNEKNVNICLSGGTFANVRVNQKILEIDNVKNIFVQQGMGDGGLAVGAALWIYKNKNKDWKPRFKKTVYLGLGFSDDKIKKTLSSEKKIMFNHHQKIEKEIALAISKNKIIGRFNGPMEWGPRALGNRSILASPSDASINSTLNERLSRTEFMPFAPIIMEEYASEFFSGYDKSHIASRFMTITYDVFKEKHSIIPAVVHVDGTARPQVVRREDNISLHTILNEYYKLTGVPVLINTSFNIHGEPIVYTPKDAIRSFKKKAVDILAIGNYLAYNN